MAPEKKLIIVESPTKAKTIAKFVENEYTVESSYGHIRDLPKSKLGIDLENNFEPQYIIPTKAKKIVTNLKKLAAKSKKVILATDEDREGEAIAWHLAQTLNLKKENYERIAFHEITKNAIQTALKNPRELKIHLVDAQQGRRILDRLVGYKLSPFLWKKIARGLSAGRVQSVTVKLIVDREEEIKNFKPEEYWTIKAIFSAASKEEFEATLARIRGEDLGQFYIKNKETADAILNELNNAGFQVVKIEKKLVKRNPLAPFTTSTLQQTAAKRLGFSAKKTMFIAQYLYEKGIITYMRTDSVNLSQESLTMAKQWLTKNLGEKYASQAPRIFTTKSRLAQEAHEAVRPTDAFKSPEKIKGADEKKLYNLIWSRFLGSQMPQAEFNATQIEIEGNEHIFRANGSMLIFDGFLRVWPQKFSEKELPNLTEKEIVDLKNFLPEQHFTEPAPRYNEASLIKILEEHGVGRPSTYAPIISVIQARNYVQKQAGKFLPTETGVLVTKVLTENFPEIVDIGFTAKMEEELDEIADSKKDWHEIVKDFYGPFSENLEKKYKEVEKVAPQPELTDIRCEKCGQPMAIKFSRFGRFLACSGFPECKNTKPMAKEDKKIGMACPKCQSGEVIEKRVNRGRARGKTFWGCNRYPKCDYASWINPLKPRDAPAQTNEQNSKN